MTIRDDDWLGSGRKLEAQGRSMVASKGGTADMIRYGWQAAETPKDCILVIE